MQHGADDGAAADRATGAARHHAKSEPQSTPSLVRGKSLIGIELHSSDDEDEDEDEDEGAV